MKKVLHYVFLAIGVTIFCLGGALTLDSRLPKERSASKNAASGELTFGIVLFALGGVIIIITKKRPPEKQPER
jgi:hypothetical protein